MASDNPQQQQGQETPVDVEQLKAEAASYKALVEQLKPQLEKSEALIAKLRKVESRAERSESILKEALGAVTVGVPEHYQKLVEPLPIEQKWELLKAYPRQLEPSQPAAQQPAATQPAQQQQPAASSQQTQAPQQQPATAPGRPVAPPIESAYDREKRALQQSGALNMHSLAELIVKHSK